MLRLQRTLLVTSGLLSLSSTFAPYSIASDSVVPAAANAGHVVKGDVDTLKTIRSLAKKVHKKAMIMAYQFEQPIQLTAKFPNVIGSVLIQAIPPPDGLVTVGKIPPSQGVLKFIAKDINQDIERMSDASDTGIAYANKTWATLQKTIASLQQTSDELVAVLSGKNPNFKDVGSRIVSVYDLSDSVKHKTKTIRQEESSQLATSKQKNL